MFSVKQEEYIKTYTSIFVSIAINTIIYFVAVKGLNYLWIRVIIAFGVVLTGSLIYYFVKRKYPYIAYNKEPDMEAIKGTKDMVFNKFASLVNSSVPLIYIASIVGATYASVYAVYMIVFGFITKLSMMVANAVQNGFGQMIAEKEPEEVYKKFKVFEFSLIFIAFILISISTSITMPFIKFYTKNVHDVNYINWTYLYLFTGITLVKITHIPSGIVMLMSGAFKKSKNFQINALVVLIIGIIIGGIFWEVSGILSAILIAAIVLGIQEIIYSRKKYFKIGFRNLFKTLIILGLTTLGLIYIELQYVPKELTFIEIIYYVIIVSFINFAVMISIAYFFFYDVFIEVLSIIKLMVKKNNK